MSSLPSIRLLHRAHRAEAIEAELEATAMPADPTFDLDRVSFSRAQQAARRMRTEDAARRGTSVPPPPRRAPRV